MAYFTLYAHALEVCFDCSFACIKRIHLAGRIICSRCLVCTPMINDLRYMSDSAGSSLHTAENKVMILCPVKFLTETADLIHDSLADYKKVTDIVVGPQEIQVEIRFQMRLEMFT